MAIKVFNEKEPAPGTALGKPELYAVAVGTVIGAGVVTLIVPAIKMTGYSAWLAYLTAVLLGFFIVLPYIFTASTVRISGGIYSMLCGLAGPRVGGIYAYVFLTQCFGLSLFGSSAAAYLGDIIPALGSDVGRIITGFSLLTFFYIINLMGIDIMAKVQKLMVWLLIAALLMFIIAGLINLKLPVFDVSDPNWLVSGWGFQFNEVGNISGGFLGAVLLFIFSCNGYSATVGYGRDAKNPKRDIPWVLIACVPTLAILYTGVAVAGAGVMTLEEYGASTTLVFAARRIFSPALFYLFIIGGPLMALLSTLNTSFAARGLSVGQSCSDGWLPEWFGKKNKRGVSVYAMTFFYITGVAPILFDLPITTLTNLVQLAASFFALLYFIGFIRMPKLYPESWKKSRLHVPDGLYYFFCCVSLGISCVTIWKSLLSVGTALAIGNVVVIAIFTIASLLRAKSADIKIRTSIWSGDPEEDERAAAMNRALVEKTSEAAV